MTSKPQRTFKATALFLVVSLVQLYVVGVSAVEPQGDQLQGSVTTRDNRPITVNGNSATSGQTILSGAMVDTPAGVGATINLSPLGSVDLAPGARTELTFGDGQIKVRLIQGCAVVQANNGTYGEINNGQEKLTSNDATEKRAANLDVCSPTGASPVINQGAAANAGAGATGAAVAVATVGGATTAGGVGAGVIIGAIGLGTLATLAIIVPCRRGRNPSPGEPRGRNDECR